jgi:hypothetical protein
MKGSGLVKTEKYSGLSLEVTKTFIQNFFSEEQATRPGIEQGISRV